MRKLILIGVTIFVASLSACTEEYTCQCVVKYYGTPPGITDSSVFEFAIRDTKKQAAAKCEANSTKQTQDNITMDEQCRLY